MSNVVEQKQNATVVSQSLLDQAVSATKQTDSEHAKQLLATLTKTSLEGTLQFNKSTVKSLNDAIAGIDALLSKQLRKIMHQDNFKKLEGSWRGLNHLIKNTETSTSLKIRMMSISKKELSKDLDKAVEFDQSHLFKKLYEQEFGMPGGEPYGVLIGDYEFTQHPEDINTLRLISEVAAASFCPFVASASEKMFGFDSWTDLSKPRDLAKIFDTVEYAKWRSFQDTEDARFVTLVMPRTLARLPYGKMTSVVDEFDFEEAELSSDQTTSQLKHDNYCWMNAAYVQGTCITAAVAKYGWATAIRGAEGGGKIDNLPLHTFKSDDGDYDSQCPTEVGITDRREAELSKLGFLPLCHYKGTDYAVFFGAQTANKPKIYDNPDATANAAISARLPYIMAASRFAHYLKVMARDKVGSFMEVSDCEDWLNRWIMRYVNKNSTINQELKAVFPLSDAKISVSEVQGQPGVYNAVAWLRPWLQMEELTTSIRMVARIPMMKDK